MGMKGTVRRNIDNHFINSNIDTDVIVTDLDYQVDYPLEIFHLIERLCLGRRRLFLKFKWQSVESFQGLNGWLTISEDTDQNVLDLKTYESYFVKNGKQDRYLGTTEEIESLRPKSPSNKM